MGVLLASLWREGFFKKTWIVVISIRDVVGQGGLVVVACRAVGNQISKLRRIAKSVAATSFHFADGMRTHDHDEPSDGWQAGS